MQQALADGAAVAEAESLEPSSEARSRSLSSRRQPGPPSTEPRRSWILGIKTYRKLLTLPQAVQYTHRTIVTVFFPWLFHDLHDLGVLGG